MEIPRPSAREHKPTRAHESSETDQPIVSVITPNRGRIKLLERALQSVVAQSLGAWEAIVVDDSPSNLKPSLRKVAGLDPRIRLIDGDGSGDASARRTGTLAARGRLLAFLDSDDEWLREKLETHVEVWSGCGLGLSFDGYETRSRTSCEVVEPPGSLRQSGRPITPPALLRALLLDPFMHMSTCVTSKDALQSIGGYPLRNPSDLILAMRLAERFPAVYVGRVLTVKHEDSEDRLGESRGRLFKEWINVSFEQFSMILRSMPRTSLSSEIPRWVTSKGRQIVHSTIIGGRGTVGGYHENS
jgi:O-antigen biosynthesis protein